MISRGARPRCFLNVAMSLDGKIASFRREFPRFPSRADRRLMDRIRARADAVLVGSGTLRAADFPLRVRSAGLRRQRRLAGRPTQPLNILLSSSLAVPLRGRFFGAPDTRRLIVTTELAPAHRIRALSSSSEILILGRRRISLKRLARELSNRGIRELLLEGGGETNFMFFSQGLVDEIYLTVCPLIIGGAGSPTPADGRGFPEKRFLRYRPVSCHRTGREIFLHFLRSRTFNPR